MLQMDYQRWIGNAAIIVAVIFSTGLVGWGVVRSYGKPPIEDPFVAAEAKIAQATPLVANPAVNPALAQQQRQQTQNRNQQANQVPGRTGNNQQPQIARAPQVQPGQPAQQVRQGRQGATNGQPNNNAVAQNSRGGRGGRGNPNGNGGNNVVAADPNAVQDAGAVPADAAALDAGLGG